MINPDQNPEFVNSFLDYSITILNKSPNSVKEYNYDLNTFLKYMKIHFKLTKETDLKKINIKDFSLDTLKRITLEDIHSFLSYLALNQQSKPATRARKISTIRIFFSYLSQKAHLITENPAQNLETPKLDKRLPKYLSLDDSKKLLNVTESDENDENKERDYAIITLFLNCGLRLSELVGINISNIDFSENRLTVIGKGNKERMVFYKAVDFDLFKKYLQVRNNILKGRDSDYLIVSKTGKLTTRTVEKIVKDYALKKNVKSKITPHTLRHTFATDLLNEGADIRSVGELLGHESLSTTQIYTHVSADRLKQVYAKTHPRNKN